MDFDQQPCWRCYFPDIGGALGYTASDAISSGLSRGITGGLAGGAGYASGSGGSGGGGGGSGGQGFVVLIYYSTGAGPVTNTTNFFFMF